MSITERGETWNSFSVHTQICFRISTFKLTSLSKRNIRNYRKYSLLYQTIFSVPFWICWKLGENFRSNPTVGSAGSLIHPWNWFFVLFTFSTKNFEATNPNLSLTLLKSIHLRFIIFHCFVIVFLTSSIVLIDVIHRSFCKYLIYTFSDIKTFFHLLPPPCSVFLFI